MLLCLFSLIQFLDFSLLVFAISLPIFWDSLFLQCFRVVVLWLFLQSLPSSFSLALLTSFSCLFFALFAIAVRLIRSSWSWIYHSALFCRHKSLKVVLYFSLADLSKRFPAKNRQKACLATHWGVHDGAISLFSFVFQVTLFWNWYWLCQYSVFGIQVENHWFVFCVICLLSYSLACFIFARYGAQLAPAQFNRHTYGRRDGRVTTDFSIIV